MIELVPILPMRHGNKSSHQKIYVFLSEVPILPMRHGNLDSENAQNAK